MWLDVGTLVGILIKATLSLLEVSSTSTEGFHSLKQQTKCVKRDLKDGLSNKRFWDWFLEIRSQIYHRGQIPWLSVLFVCNFDNTCVAACSPADGEEKRNCFVFLCVCRLRTSELGWHSWEKPNAKLMLVHDGLTWVPCFLGMERFQSHERQCNLLEQKIELVSHTNKSPVLLISVSLRRELCF